MGRSIIKGRDELVVRKANKRRSIYVNIGAIEDGEDWYIEVTVPRKGVVHDSMLQVQEQANIDFEDDYYLEDEHGDILKGKWHLEEIEGDTLYLKQK